MKTCDVCQSPLGMLKKFKYANGYICKECYKKASRNFTETITQKNLSEIKKLCNNEREIDEEFEITGKIGNYLLVDGKNNKICVLNNRMTAKKVSAPNFYDIKNIVECKIICHPTLTVEELEGKVAGKEDEIIDSLKVSISMKNKKKPVEIVMISNSVRTKSYAFRQVFYFAKRITEEIRRLQQKNIENVS